MADQVLHTNNTMIAPPPSMDALLPSAMGEKLEDIGVKKATMGPISLFMLAILAGAFIALGAILCTGTVTGTSPFIGFGLSKLVGGFVFCLGLILVIVSGSELFTGNNLIIMGVMSRKVTVIQLLYNWTVVYIGNFVGAIITAWILYMCEQYKLGDAKTGAYIGVTAMKIANGKCSLTFTTALFRGIMCNALVCLAVWMCMSARSVTDKIMAIIPPITAFVAAGFEHCVANMYFIPIGLMIKRGSINASAATGNIPATLSTVAVDCTNLTWGNFFIANLLPVTIGNIIGGAFFVGAFYWVIYRRKFRVGSLFNK